jgi:hypothetical protein
VARVLYNQLFEKEGMELKMELHEKVKINALFLDWK